jgi:hypothetical protein
VAARRGRLSTKSIDVSPEGTLVEGAELFFSLGDAVAEVEDDEAMREGAEFEGDFYGIVGLEFAGVHGVLEDGYGGVEGGGATCLEVAGIDACAFARDEEHEFVEVGGLEGGVEEDVSYLEEPLLEAALEVERLDLGGEGLEALVGDGVEEGVAVGEVAIDGHGGDADFFCDGAHGDGGVAAAVEEIARGGKDCGGGGGLCGGGFG